MLTDEQAQELFKNEHCNISKELAGILARAIIAAVLPEGWVAVPKEPTLAMLDCLRSDITSNLEKRYQAMLAAAPKAQAEKQEPFPFSADRVTYHKTAASPLDLMECLQDRPVEPSKAVQGKCVTQAEKQEPVKDEPVALHHDTADLVNRFSQAMREKLAKAERKYGYSNLWANCDWMDECRAKLVEHLHKGDPLDVANYCAFLWHHGEHCKQEPVKDEPVAWMVVTSYDKLIFQNASQAEHCAEKWELVSAPLYTRPQPEPVNDEPVARVDANDDGYWADILPDRSVKVGQLLYTRPQPDLTAEVERLKLSAEHWNRLYREKCQEFHDAQANKGQEIVWLIDRIAELEALVSTREDDIRTEKMWVQRHAERIAELEEAARQARDAFEQHDGNYKLSKASGAVVEAAIAKLDAVLGNAD